MWADYSGYTLDVYCAPPPANSDTSTKYKTLNTKYETQNTKLKIQNSKYKIQKERQIQIHNSGYALDVYCAAAHSLLQKVDTVTVLTCDTP